jgi:hypothetical protein
MKTKILLSFSIFFCAAITANAQITKGKYLLGGSASYTNSKNQQGSGSKYESFNTNIQFGKVIKDNTAAGIILSYGYYNNGPENKTNVYSAGIFYRKYKPLAKGFYFFAELDGVYNYSKNTEGHFEIGNNAQRYTSNAGIISFTPGISYSVCKRMQMELLMPNLASISYGNTKTEYTSTSTTSVLTVKGNIFSANANFNTSFLNNFGIGFKFLLGK